MVAALLRVSDRVATSYRWEAKLDLEQHPEMGSVARAKKPAVQPGAAAKTDWVARRDLPALAHKADLSHQFTMLRRYWRDTGDSATVAETIRGITASPIFGGDIDVRVNVIGAAALADLGAFDEADAHMAALSASDALDEAAYQLPVAAFACQRGYTNPLIEKAARAWDVLRENAHGMRVTDLLVGKTIAVVGNGDLRGRGFADAIDAHDVVVRFNNYPKGFEEHLGSRTSVWCRGSHSTVIDRPDIGQYDLVVWGHDFEYDFLEMHEHLALLSRDTVWYPEKIAMIPHSIRANLVKQLGGRVPSTGLQLVAWLSQIRGGLAGVDLYGFGATDALVAGGSAGHFYDALGDYSARHGVDAEAAAFASLLGSGDYSDPEPPVQTTDAQPTVFMCAYRPFDPATGKTGGPAGVQHTIQMLCGDKIDGTDVRYLYEVDKARLTKELSSENKGLRVKVTDVTVGAEAIRRNEEIQARVNSRQPSFFVCHDLGSAYGALQLGQPYVLVNHLQGTIIDEMESIGQHPTDHERHVASVLENTVLLGAQRVYFPSVGAAEAYRHEGDPAVMAKVRFADHALFNTLGDGDGDVAESSSVESVLRGLGIEGRDLDRCDGFVSISDYNFAKGLDRIPSLLARYRDLTGRSVEWIVAGGVSSRELYDNLARTCRGLGVTAHLLPGRIPHDDAMALLQYADYYIMMQRRSIFDLGTLEAMRSELPLILSPVGGNLDLDVQSNVEFIDPELPGSWDEALQRIQARDRKAWGRLSSMIYAARFSPDAFEAQYAKMISDELQACGLKNASDA